MANSQIDTSKNPSAGAKRRMPRAMKMVRRVDRVTTTTSATKMKAGSQGLSRPAQPSANTNRPPRCGTPPGRPAFIGPPPAAGKAKSPRGATIQFRHGGDRMRQIGEAYVAPGVVLTGDVVLSAGVNLWYGAVLRGDLARISLGPRVNIQDGTIVHTDHGEPQVIEEGVVVGHRAVLHGRLIG